MNHKNKHKISLVLLCLTPCLTMGLLGCAKLMTDFNPVSYLTGEQLTVRRSYVAKGRIKVMGKSTQQVTTILGEPSFTRQDPVNKTERWKFIYYDPARDEISGKKKNFTIIFREERVVDIQSPDLPLKS